MKILWISHNVPYPPKTGVLQRNYNLLKEVSRIGDIYLVAFFQKAILPIQFDMDEVRRELGKICRQIEIVQMPTDKSKMLWYALVFKSIFTADPYSVNWSKSPKMSFKIRQLIDRETFNLVHFDSIGLAEYRDLVGDTPKVLNHHNIESKLMERRAEIERNLFKNLYFRMEARKLNRYERDHCKTFDLNLTVSDLDKELLLQSYPECNVQVIPNGVDIDYFYSRNGAPIKKSLIFVGGMNWYPNRDAVVHLCNDLWPLLKSEIPDISLTVVGAQPTKELLDLAGRDNKVTVTGFVDDVRPYLDRAEVYICPMRDGGGTRLKILDALAMGKAIVSTKIGCEGIDILHGQHVLLADTSLQFVKHIKNLFENPAMRQTLGHEGRKLVETKYSWKVIGNTLNIAYKRLFQSKLGEGNERLVS